MPFSTLIGNERIKKLLRRALAHGRIEQGLILAGPAGVGKRQFALAIAQALNCQQVIEGDACGQCLPCRRITAGEHLDVQTIVPDGAFIKIDQMRAMAREAQYRPFEGRRRVYIIDDAHRLNEKAANSILKTLEEPPATSLLLLVTSKPYVLLETIRSRCQMLSFAPLSPAELESYLKESCKRPVAEIRLIASLARGSIGRAMEIDLGEYRDKRNVVVQLIETMALSRDAVRLMNAAEYLGRKLDREEFEDHLDVLLGLLADVFYLKLGRPLDSLANSDIGERLGRVAEAVTLEQVTGWAKGLGEVLASLRRNVSRQLSMDSLLLGSTVE